MHRYVGLCVLNELSGATTLSANLSATLSAALYELQWRLPLRHRAAQRTCHGLLPRLGREGKLEQRYSDNEDVEQLDGRHLLRKRR